MGSCRSYTERIACLPPHQTGGVAVEFKVLGPLVVMAEGEHVQLKSVKQRTLLGMLLSQANTPVPPRRLVEELWDVPPPSAADNLRLYVYQLRRALNGGGD